MAFVDLETWLATRGAEPITSSKRMVSGAQVKITWHATANNDFIVTEEHGTWNVYTQLDGVGGAETLADADLRLGVMTGDEHLTMPGACEECLSMGWFPSSDGHGDTVERCDQCKVFDDDDKALAHALGLAAAMLADPKARGGDRFENVLEAVRVASSRIQGE